MLDKFRPVTCPIDCGVIIEVVKGVVDHTTAVFALAVANADITPGALQQHPGEVFRPHCRRMIRRNVIFAHDRLRGLNCFQRFILCIHQNRISAIISEFHLQAVRGGNSI